MHTRFVYRGMAITKVNDKLEAVLLGHAIRRQLLHSVREEYERTMQEIEADSCLLLTNQVVHWPRKNALCFPVFQDQNERVKTSGQCGDGDGDEGDGSRSSSASKPCQSPNILNLEPSDSETEIQTVIPSIEMGKTQIGAPKLPSNLQPESLQPRSLQPGSPLFLEGISLSILPEVQETCGRLHNTDEPETSAFRFPSTSSVAREHPNLPLSPCAKPSVSEPQLRSGTPLLETEVAVGSWLELPEPTLSDLPQDKESLTRLKAQLAMELLWIKQAIASRQNYLKIREELKDGTN